jgi:hypothetical protein
MRDYTPGKPYYPVARPLQPWLVVRLWRRLRQLLRGGG